MSAFAPLIEAIHDIKAPQVFSRKQSSDLQLPTAFPTPVWNSLTAHLPERFSWTEVLEAISELKQTDPKTSLIVVLTCLRKQAETQLEDLNQTEFGKKHLEDLASYAATIIAPRSRLQEGGDLSDYDQVAQQCHELAPYGLEILQIISGDYSTTLNNDVFLIVVAYVDTKELPHQCGATADSLPWMSQESCELARHILRCQFFNSDLPGTMPVVETAIIDTILKGYLRPIFARSRPRTVTSSGRKAEFPVEGDIHRGLQDDTSEVKPWKFVDHGAIAVFQWTVYRAEEALISKEWPLFIPVLLALVDDGLTRIRSRGLQLLGVFLGKLPPHILRDTGLVKVFEDAIFPTLHFLPRLTPVDESIQLLEQAYSTLLILASRQAQGLSTMPSSRSTESYMKLLERMLRHGVLSAYDHAKEHVRIVQLLFEQTIKILNEMDIYAVKFLRDLIPMHCEVIADPFATSAPDTLRWAIQSLRNIIRVCWIRIPPSQYLGQIISTLVKCFLRVSDDTLDADQNTKDQLQSIKADIVNTMSILWTVLNNEIKEDLLARTAEWTNMEPELKDLFANIVLQA